MAQKKQENGDEREGKYLTFILDQEEYGIHISNVREIIGMMTITRVPRCPDFVKGVINLRGKVIPVVDLRTRFDMAPVENTDRTCIVVVEICRENERVVIGLVVDSVSEVLAVKGADIEDAPSFGARLDTRYILGMAKLDGGVKILLEIEKVLDTNEMASVKSLV